MRRCGSADQEMGSLWIESAHSLVLLLQNCDAASIQGISVIMATQTDTLPALLHLTENSVSISNIFFSRIKCLFTQALSGNDGSFGSCIYGDRIKMRPTHLQKCCARGGYNLSQKVKYLFFKVYLENVHYVL